MRISLAATLVSAALAAGAVAAQSPSTNAADKPLKVMAGVELMSWWFQGSPTPVPVVTDGLYGAPGTNVLLGGGTVDTNPNPGLRLSLTYVPNQKTGIDFNWLYVRERTTTDGVSSSGLLGSTDLFVPFFNPARNAEDGTELSYSPLYSGSATTQLTNSMMGAELNVNWPIAAAAPWDIRVFGGFRWWRLKEKYAITTSSPNNAPQPEDIWMTSDTFDATNNFWGGQVGARGAYRQDKWLLSGAAQVALGGMVQKVGVNGYLVTNDFTNYASTQQFAGGYFALPTNAGTYSRTVFAAVPELRLNIGYFVTPTTTISIGYDVLYASNVARPGNQMNRNINPTQAVSYTGEPPAILDGPAQPTFGWSGSSFWAQAVSIALHIRY
jgi:hypothetical protein